MKWSYKQKNIVVAGVGNELMADDGVGIYITRLLSSSEELKQFVKFIDAGLDLFNSLPLPSEIEHLFIIDAVPFETETDIIFYHNLKPVYKEKFSVHDVDILEQLFQWGLLGGGVLPPITLAGIRARKIFYSTELSNETERLIPVFISALKDKILACYQKISEKEHKS